MFLALVSLPQSAKAQQQGDYLAPPLIFVSVRVKKR